MSPRDQERGYKNEPRGYTGVRHGDTPVYPKPLEETTRGEPLGDSSCQVPAVTGPRPLPFSASSNGVWDPSEWSTADDPRCFEHRDLPRDKVPPCRRCADARRWFEGQKTDERAARRAAIDACDLCDDNGLRTTHTADGRPLAVKCDHKPPVATAPIAAQEPTRTAPTNNHGAPRYRFNDHTRGGDAIKHAYLAP